jgi:hypothetical protein
MKILKWAGGFLSAHATKLLGIATTIIAGAPLIDGLVTAAHKPYWGLANLVLGALTVARGIQNSGTNATPAP